MMKNAILSSLIVLAQLAVAADDDTTARKDLAGTWKGRVYKGATGHKLDITTTRIVGTKDEKHDLGEASFKLDLTKKPPWMDATRTKGREKGQTYLGIYSVQGEILRWCVSTPGNRRPSRFATKGSQFYLVLKREKGK